MKLDQIIAQDKIREIPERTVVGIDVGSRQAKGVLLSEGSIFTSIIPTDFSVKASTDALIENLTLQAGISAGDIEYSVTTGYGRSAIRLDRIPYESLTEIICHAKGAYFLADDIRTVIDIGGQDSKAISVDPKDGSVIDFVMNDKCAAGTGRFLERMAAVLELDLTEFGQLATTSRSASQISSQCVVFAESEVISQRAEGKKTEDISLGIHLSVARRVTTLLKRVGIKDNILFTGGVSNNTGMVHAFETLLNTKLACSRLDTVYAGALGACVFAASFAEKGHIGAGSAAERKIDISRMLSAIKNAEEDFVGRKSGRKNMAFLCAYVPIELLDAAGVSYMRLMHAGDRNEISLGENITQNMFCDLTKSVVGGFISHNPKYEAIDKLYFFNTCDCMRKTVDAINAKFVPAVTYFVPRDMKRDGALAYLTAEMEAFRRDLEEETHHEITDEAIQESIKKYNRARSLLRNISEQRKHKNIKSLQVIELIRGYYSVPVDEYIEILEDIKKQCNQIPKEPDNRIKLMISGGIVASGDVKITRIIEEELGGQVVFEDCCTGLKPLDRLIEEEGDPVASLAKGYGTQAPCARMNDMNDMLDYSVRKAGEYGVDGVIYRYMKFCPGYSISIKKISDAYKEHDLPLIILPTDYAQGDEGQIKIRLEAFMEMLKGGK